MYCPQCAAQLIDNDKFCRACGADLKAAAVALAKQPFSSKAGKNKTTAPKKEKTWMEWRRQGMRKAAEGATMIGASLLIALIINLLSDHPDRMGLWAVFFGWIACWGVFSLASGLGGIAQGASMRSETQLTEAAPAPVIVPDTDPLVNSGLPPLLSVAENTTRSLEPASREVVAKE